MGEPREWGREMGSQMGRRRAGAASRDHAQCGAEIPISVVAQRSATVAARDPAVAEVKGRPGIGTSVAVDRAGGAERVADEKEPNERGHGHHCGTDESRSWICSSAHGRARGREVHHGVSLALHTFRADAGSVRARGGGGVPTLPRHEPEQLAHVHTDCVTVPLESIGGGVEEGFRRFHGMSMSSSYTHVVHTHVIHSSVNQS